MGHQPKIVDVYARKQLLDTVPPDPSKVLIVIEGSRSSYESYPDEKAWLAVRTVAFDDFEKDYTAKSEGKWPHKAITRDQAQELIMLMHFHQSRDFVVCCSGGISRSVAIGCFMRDFLEYELVLNTFKSDWSLNKLVYVELGRAFSDLFIVRPKT
jgi:hypothetical protein